MHCRTAATAVAAVGVVVDVGVGIRADELILRHFFANEHLQKFPIQGRIFFTFNCFLLYFSKLEFCVPQVEVKGMVIRISFTPALIIVF